MSSREIATHFGEIAGFALPVVVGIIASIVMTKKREDNKVTAWPTIAGIFISLLALVGSAGIAGGDAARGAASSDDVAVDSAVAGAAADFPTAISPDYLVQYSEFLKKAIAQQVSGQPGASMLDPTKVKAVSSVIRLGNHDVIKTIFDAPGITYLIQFAGVRGSDAVNVVCRSRSAQHFTLLGTPCEKKTIETFGPGRVDG